MPPQSPDKLIAHPKDWTIIGIEACPLTATDADASSPQAPSFQKFFRLFSYKNKSPKSVGKNQNGFHRGFYTDGTQKYLFKRSRTGDPGHTVAEFVASYFYQVRPPSATTWKSSHVSSFKLL